MLKYSTELQVSHQIHSLLWWDDETKWTKANSQSYHFLDLLSIEMMQRYCSFRLSTALFAHGIWVQFKHLRRLPGSSNLKGLIWANCRLFRQGWTRPQYVWCGWYGSFSNFGHPKRNGWIHQSKLQEGDIVPEISVSSFYIPPILKTSVKTGVPYLFLATFRQAALCQLQTTGVNFTVFWLLSWAFRAWRIRFHDPSSGRRGKAKKCHSTLVTFWKGNTKRTWVCPNPGDWKINRNLHIPSAKNIRKAV